MRVKQSIDIMSALADFRRDAKIKQSEISELTDISKSNISRLEKCIHSPTVGMLIRYADALSVELIFSVSKML